MEDPEKNKMEWVEIIEPRTKEHMYANLTTGECVWDPPPGVLVKRTTDSQWWELFDHKTSRFYYYNAATQRTVWHRPLNCDIIPLAKLQTLKQNTQVKTPGQESPSRGAEAASSLLMPAGSAGTNSSTLSSTDSRPSVKKESVATQTPSRSALSRPERNGSSSGSSRRRSEDKAVLPESRQPPSTNTASTSPLASPRPHRKHHHHHHHHNCAKQKDANPVEDAPQRKSTASGGNSAWYSRHGKSQDSGRSSDSSTLSLSKRSLDNKTQMRTLLDPVPIEFGIPGSTASTGRNNVNKGGLELSRQRSLDSETTSGVLPTQSRTPTPVRSGAVSKPNDLFYRDGSLSRSLSFMHQQRRPQTARGQGPLFDLWSPQREHLIGGDGSSAPGLDSLCTPMINRKQRSLESSASMSSKPSRSQHLLESMKSTNNHRRPLGSSASFRCTTTNPLSFGSDSSPSPKREDSLKLKDSLNRIRSGESSPHDSGLATTGSRASQDSNPKKLDQPEASGGGGSNYDSVPLYSNIDYNYYLDPKAQAHLLPLQQYILEQAKLSGYRFGDSSSPLVDDDKEKFHSDEDEDDDTGRRRRANRLQVHRHTDHQNDDSDDFADDEGMSNVEDSSSLEYLDESQYLEEDDHYTQFLLPPVPPQRHQSKPMIHHPLPLNSPHQILHHQRRSPATAAAATEVIVEPEYTEADPGFIHHHRSVVDGPSKSIMPSGSSSSLRPRPKEPIMPQSSSLYSPVLERAGSFAAMDGFRKTTLEAPSSTSIQSAFLQRSPSSVCSKGATTPTDGDIEKYAQSNLNIHKKGLFRKNLSIRDMLSWSKDPIRKPMLPLEDKLLKKEACDLFKLVQVYMGDRKCKPGMTCNSVALELCNHAWNKPALRDELYLHICRQTTENPRKESLRRGWELMAVCLYFFPPSPKLEPYLDGYINRHRDPGLNFTEVDKWPIHVQVSHYATISCRRLLRIGASGRRNERKPTLEEIEQARLQIFRPSMFGNTLDEIMTVQRDRFPHRKLPWIQTTLSEEILRLQGAQTEGIFRVPADVDEVNSLKNRMDQWEVGQVSDAHVPASLLKLWYRELYESLIPDELYDDCVQYCSDPERAIAIVHRLPEFHRLVLAYLIRFLQIFAQTEVSSVTKMDASNLAMVMAPNCLRCNASDPKIIFDNARKEMAFIRTLIQHLDTSFMEGVV